MSTPRREDLKKVQPNSEWRISVLTQPRAKKSMSFVVPSISVSRKLPAIAEEYSVGIEHGEDDELDVLAKLLGDHVLAGEEFQHTLRDKSDSIKL